jgi:DNA-binding transcriptional ArsR family regulator
MYVDTSITADEGLAAQAAHLDLLSRFFKALSEPTRLRVVLALTEQCRPVSDIAEATGLPQPLVSHHLRILRDAGIAKPDRRGNQVYY